MKSPVLKRTGDFLFDNSSKEIENILTQSLIIKMEVEQYYKFIPREFAENGFNSKEYYLQTL
ncbi:hypothetical protein BH09BAC5_BH09BAC5_18590 [soil metagenome]